MTAARFLRERKGAAAVEAALILPVFLLLAVFVVDFAFAFQARNALASALTLGAQYAVQTGPDLNRDRLSSFLPAVRMALFENAGRIEDLRVDVTFNGSTNPDDIGKFYCVVGTDFVLKGHEAEPCADGSLSGRFLTIDARGRLPALFAGNPLTGGGTDLRDAVTVRLQ